MDFPLPQTGRVPTGEVGPPPLPPEIAALSQTPTSGQVGEGEKPNSKAGLPRLVFEIERSLDSIADAVPGVADQVDDMKSTLRDLLASALQGGGQEQGGSEDPGSYLG